MEQHTALQAEIVSAAQASVSGKPDDVTCRRGGSSARHHRNGGGPGGLIGGVVGGMFRQPIEETCAAARILSIRKSVDRNRRTALPVADQYCSHSKE
jgi:hypothetical protein